MGDYQVRHFVAGKYFRRFYTAKFDREHRLPSEDERAEWSKAFRDEHLATAYAVSLGYADRPEVVGNVSRMGRHMLSLSTSPFYKILCPHNAALSDEELKQNFVQHPNV